MTQSLIIVAFAADQPWSPRGERALEVCAAALRIAPTVLISPSPSGFARRNLRRLTHVVSPLVLDPWEPEAWWTLRRRRERPGGALLVGFPFSAVYWAARWLVSEDVPYLVDLGDPWALTLPMGERPAMGGSRAARCERFVWRHAAAGLVTTRLQAEALRELFPELPFIVRPNGYRRTRCVARTPSQSRESERRTLRLVHYGNLYEPRLDIVPLLAGLARSGHWDSVVLTQQGEDWTGALRAAPPEVQIEFTRPRPWEDVVEAAGQHDLAVVVGNRNPAQLPSKVVQYLTLPIPRLAVVGGKPSDALTEYVRDKPGWLTLPRDTPTDLAACAVAAHVQRDWRPEELLAPAQESWDAVAGVLLDAILNYTAVAARSTRRADPDSRHVAAPGSGRPRRQW